MTSNRVFNLNFYRFEETRLFVKRSEAVASVRMWQMALVVRPEDAPGHQESLGRVQVDGGVAAQLELGLGRVLAGDADRELGNGSGQASVRLNLTDLQS